MTTNPILANPIIADAVAAVTSKSDELFDTYGMLELAPAPKPRPVPRPALSVQPVKKNRQPQRRAHLTTRVGDQFPALAALANR